MRIRMLLLLAAAFALAGCKGRPTANTDLLSLQMMSARNGWAVSAENVYRTTDRGLTWRAVTPSGAAPGAGRAPLQAFFLDDRTAWMTTAQDGSITVFRTDNSGRTWQHTELEIPNQGGAQLFFVDARQGWMLVPGGAAASHEAVALLATSNGGATWRKVAETHPQDPQPGDIPFVGDKTGIAFLDAHTGWLTGYWPVPGQVYFYVTHDGGATWAQQPLPVPAAFADEQMGAYPPQVFGPSSAVLPVTTSDSILFFVTHDGGATWTAGAPVTRSQQGSQLVWNFADAAHGLVADGDRLWRTSDGGITWTGGQPVPALQNVRQIDALGAGCWALTGEQIPTHLLRSTDNCQTWAP